MPHLDCLNIEHINLVRGTWEGVFQAPVNAVMMPIFKWEELMDNDLIHNEDEYLELEDLHDINLDLKKLIKR